MNNLDEKLENNLKKEVINDSKEKSDDFNEEITIQKSLEESENLLKKKSAGEIGDENTDASILMQESDNSEESTIISKESEEQLLTKRLKEFHRNLIEAALYAAGRPLDIEELSTKLEIRKKEVEELIKDLLFDYLNRSTALVINSLGETFQMTIKTEYIEKVSKFAKGGAIAERYLRTLTIIALKQPILKSLVIKLRGSGAYEHVKYLLDNGLVSAVKKGRSHEITTTDKYAEMFGLPKNKEEMKKKMVKQLGIDENKDKAL
ncbi:MAG: SMC-Scp complex subunit ScpB [Promethearchaeota archaeon]